MIKLDKLKGKILENRKTYQECADAIGISRTAFSDKMNNKSEFTVLEMIKLSDYLNLTLVDRVDIFSLMNNTDSKDS